MSGKNVLAIIGTGGGKSLTFMLPAVLATKPTLVVSPTRSLIEDLLSRSENNGIKSCMFLGGMDTDVLQHQKQTFKQYNLVYATPEALEQHLLEGLTEGDLSVERVVFDEAHTINTWGSTFRPKYREVSEKLARLDAPKLLLSATIPGKIQADLKQLLGGESWKVVAHTVHRENLTLRVKDRDSKYMEELIAYIRERGEDTGIVYCVSENDVSKIHAELHKKDIKCVKYHGQLSEAVKQVSFQKWMSGECKVIVANSSFGMGIDKTDVRYVVHIKLPTSTEEYFQQCGRAGRDGLPADCLLFYSYSDKSMLYKLFNREGLITRQHYTLNELISYLENVVHCRHKIIMEYFGEERQDFSCLTKCDNCLSRGSFCLADGTSEASKVVQTVVELGNRKVNANMLKLILIGSKQKKVQDAGCDELSNFGCLSKKMPSILLDKFVHMLIH